MQLSLAKSTPTLKSYYSRNSQQKKDFYKNALIIMHLSITYFCMLKDSLKLMIKFPPPKWVGYFTIFLQKLAL